jgi:hypothetical protein
MPVQNQLTTTSLQQAYTDYLLAVITDMCVKQGTSLPDGTFIRLKSYVETGIGTISDGELSMEVRHQIELKISILIEKIISKAKEENYFDPVISIKIFEDIRDIFCPGFFPFC